MNIADFLLLFEYAANFDQRKRGKMMNKWWQIENSSNSNVHRWLKVRMINCLLSKLKNDSFASSYQFSISFWKVNALDCFFIFECCHFFLYVNDIFMYSVTKSKRKTIYSILVHFLSVYWTYFCLFATFLLLFQVLISFCSYVNSTDIFLRFLH